MNNMNSRFFFHCTVHYDVKTMNYGDKIKLKNNHGSCFICFDIVLLNIKVHIIQLFLVRHTITFTQYFS